MEKKEEIKFKDGIVQYIDDDGTILDFPCKVQVFYSVYVLFDKTMPIYVGCTSDIQNRIKSHKSTKVFDGYKVVYENAYRSKALNFESVAIAFLKSFNYEINHNKQNKFKASEIYPVKCKKNKSII